MLNYTIQTKTNVGPFGHHYFEFYKKEITHWDHSKCLFDIQLPELNLRSKLIGILPETDVAEGSRMARESPSQAVEHEIPDHNSGIIISYIFANHFFIIIFFNIIMLHFFLNLLCR
jgi:hypothetical protein